MNWWITIVLLVIAILLIILIPVLIVQWTTTEPCVTPRVSESQSKDKVDDYANDAAAADWQVFICNSNSSNEEDYISYIRFYEQPVAFPNLKFLPGTQANIERLWNRHSVIVLFNDAERNLKHVPRAHVLGISHEPNVFTKFSKERQKYVKTHCSLFLVGDAKGLELPFISHYNFVCGTRPDYVIYPCDKTSVMSLMVSVKKITHGHQYRRDLAEYILTHQDLPIDIFGTGCEALKAKYPSDSRLKGQFEDKELYQNYQYTIAVENVRESHYISEKYTNAIVHNTVPVYLGCPNIETYFGARCAIYLTGSLEQDIPIIMKICQDPESYILDLNFAKKQLLPGGKANFATYLTQSFIPRYMGKDA